MTTNDYTSQGKRKAPNGMYWGNVLSKCVMIEPLNNGQFRAWSNSSKFIEKNNWTIAENDHRKGWGYMDYLEQEITFFNWN